MRRRHKKVGLVPLGRKSSAENQTTIVVDGWRALVDGVRCGGEGGGSGRFVSWLRAEIRPPREGARMILMVVDGWWRSILKKNA